MYIKWNSSAKEACLFSPIYLFIYSIIYISMNSCIFYTFGHIHYYVIYFIAQIVSALPLELFQGGSSVPLISLFSKHFRFVLRHYKMLQTQFAFSSLAFIFDEFLYIFQVIFLIYFRCVIYKCSQVFSQSLVCHVILISQLCICFFKFLEGFLCLKRPSSLVIKIFLPVN